MNEDEVLDQYFPLSRDELEFKKVYVSTVRIFITPRAQGSRVNSEAFRQRRERYDNDTL